MFIIPFLFGPSGFSQLAYKSTKVEIPIWLNTDSERIRVYKGSQYYDQAVETLPGHNIKTELQPFFDRMGIRKDLIVAETYNLGICAAQGTNFFTKGDAIIYVTPNFQYVDKDACQWVMKHETSHIKNNDCFTMQLVPAICTIAAATFSTFQMQLPVIPSILITITVGIIAQAIFSTYREGKADDLAIAESSVEELKGGRRFLMACKEVNLEARKTTWTKIAISSSGENRFDILHPSTASRLRKIEDALQHQHIEIDDQIESEKINKLINFIDVTQLTLEDELKKLGTLELITAMYH